MNDLVILTLAFVHTKNSFSDSVVARGIVFHKHTLIFNFVIIHITYIVRKYKNYKNIYKRYLFTIRVEVILYLTWIPFRTSHSFINIYNNISHNMFTVHVFQNEP